jgi:hypothetical protein
MKTRWLVIVFAVSISVSGALGQIPRVLSYQGILTDTSGVPKPDSLYSMTFRMYSVAIAGSAKWTETKNVQVKGGLFSTMLGDVTPIPDSLLFDRQYWLGLQLGANPEVTPRIQMTTSPYSMSAMKAETAKVALASAGNWSSSGNVVYYNAGKVGIGTSTPSGLLEVRDSVLFENALYVLNQLGTGIDANSFSESYSALHARNAWGGNGVSGDAGRITPGLSGIGVRGSSTNNYGVAGISDTVGVFGDAHYSSYGIGVVGKGGGVGGYFEATNATGWAGIFNGKVQANLVQINGGSDMAEPFEVESNVSPEPGTVMTIDPDHPGKLSVSTGPYDPKVAGIISGAGGVHPGLTLKQDGVMAGTNLVAIAGRVYCKAEATSSPIEPGDLLTTSSLAGLAMKAVDKERSHGCVIGKAMSGLKEGKGLILVLVNLQ